MTLRTLGAVGLSAAALAAISGATPAFAAPNCGVAPAGATLTVLSGTTCQIDFATVGAYNFTVPADSYGLQALLVGAGSGSANDQSTGYAGVGGLVRYVDYSGTVAGDPIDIIVGAGGESSFRSIGDDGEPSTTTLGVVTATAEGGDSGNISTNCLPEGSTSVFAVNGNSATTILSGVANCEDAYAPGLNPSSYPTDSYFTARPAIFSSLNLTVGAGGRILATANPLLADSALDGTGNGSDIHYTSVTNEFDGANNVGGSGRVIFRYSIVLPAVSPALAATGSDVAPALTIAAVTAGLGAVLLAASRRRKRA